MSYLRRGVIVAVTVVLALAALAVVFLLVVSRPEPEEPCAPGFAQCVHDAAGWLERADCRIELFHCRRSGPEHWERGPTTSATRTSTSAIAC